jgi:hypothetical protein
MNQKNPRIRKNLQYLIGAEQRDDESARSRNFATAKFLLLVPKPSLAEFDEDLTNLHRFHSCS